MGQPVTVIEKPTPRPDVIRYEINRAITGTGHESFTAAPGPAHVRAVDELARLLFDTGKVQAVHVNGNVITVQVRGDARGGGFGPLIEELFLYYREGVRVPTPDDFAAPADS